MARKSNEPMDLEEYDSSNVKQPQASQAAVPAVNDQLPDFMQKDLEKYGGAGVSQAKEDSDTPRWVILQALSPQCQKKDEKYIEGAEAGMILNSATSQLIDAEQADHPLRIVPCGFRRQFLEWEPRGSDTQPPVAIHDESIMRKVTETIDQQTGRRKFELANGNEIVETVHQFGINADTGELGVTSFVSTQLSFHRKWNDMRKLFKKNGTAVQSFARIYNLHTRYQKNRKGAWYGWSCDWKSSTWATVELYEAGRAFYDLVVSGEVQIGNSRPNYGIDYDNGATHESAEGDRIPI